MLPPPPLFVSMSTNEDLLASIQKRVEDAMAMANEFTSPAECVAAAVAVMLENERTVALSPVIAFINDRPSFRTAMRNTSSDPDYHRWSGHAEARAVLAGKLGLTAPDKPGEQAVPQTTVEMSAG